MTEPPADTMNTMRYDSSQPEKTLADYLAIAVGPVLIMLMVGSLVFFLIEIGYRGSFSEQVKWTLFWFTVASVLVSRISIEQGSSYGSVYGIALGVATGFRLVAFLGAQFSALILLAVIWWCASKLVWDCTFIDDDADASGQGLLQHAGMESAEGLVVGPAGEEQAAAPASGKIRAAVPSAKARPHAPGLWVIYFALGSLPVFGVGQWTIPLSDHEARGYAFVLAFLFVASALVLLLTTSFLGLRRYLRQRRLVMPATMAGSWMAWGGGILAVVLLGSLLLPRPRGAEVLASLGLGIRERAAKASEYAWMKGQAADGEGRRIGKKSDARQKAGEGQEGSAGGTKGAAENAADGRSGTTRDGEANGGGDGDGGSSKDGTAADGKGASDGQAQSGARESGGGRSSASTNPLESVAGTTNGAQSIRLLSYLLGAAVLAYLLVRYGRQWLEALRRGWTQRRKTAPSVPSGTAQRSRAFTDFPDPFASGLAQQMSPAELTAYTFDALQAWAADAGRGRREEQTPMEFGESLVMGTPEWEAEIRGTVRLYLGVAYGGVKPAAEATDVLRRLWAALV